MSGETIEAAIKIIAVDHFASCLYEGNQFLLTQCKSLYQVNCVGSVDVIGKKAYKTDGIALTAWKKSLSVKAVIDNYNDQ